MRSSNRKGILLGFPEYSGPARNLATAAGLDFVEIEVHYFPDGESRIRLPEHIPQRVFICRSLDRPNEFYQFLVGPVQTPTYKSALWNIFRQAYTALPIGKVMYIDLRKIQACGRCQIPGRAAVFRKTE